MNTTRGTPRVGFATSTLTKDPYKRLGIRTTDISRNLFIPSNAPGSSSFSTGGKIVRSEFFGFWGQLAISESGDARTFFETLLEQIREIDIRQQAAGSTGLPILINGIPQASIYNTLAFMICTPSIRLENDKLHIAYNQYADPIRDALRGTDSPGLKNLMRLIAIRTQAEQSDENVIAPLIMSATHLIPKEVRLIDWIKQPTIDETDIQPNEHGFIYNYLSTLLQERGVEVLSQLLKAIYDKAHSLPQQAKMSLPNAEQSLFAILHMMKQFISTNPIPDAGFLDCGLRTLRAFTLWQQPYGRLTENMIALLRQEMLTPGYNRRQLITHESLVVDYGTTAASGGQPALNSFYRHVKPIFYIYDTLDPTSLPLLNIIDPQSLQQQQLVRPQVTIVDPSAGQSPPAPILTQILMQAFDFISPFKADEVTAIQNLSQEKILPFNIRLQQLEQRYKEQSEQGQWSLEQREQDYIQLKNDLLKIARTSNGPAMFQVPFNRDGLQLTPSLPPIEHVRVPVELKAKNAEHESTNTPGYPASAMYERLRQILEAYAPDPSLKFEKSSPDGPKLREIRFVLIGNDRYLQHVVTAYYLLMSNSPTVFNGLDVKFFLVPCTKNLFANYLAKNDLWYYRHIYSFFRSQYPFLIPFLRDDETEVRTNNEVGLMGYPTQFLRDIITQYVREASHTYKMVIFKLEGRAELTSNEPSDVIPFVQRVEIGLTPAIEEFKAKQGAAGANLKMEDVLKDKTFLYSPVELNIKYLKIDLSGQPKPEIIDDPIPYQSVTLSHVPRKGDLGNIPDPSSKGIELFVTPAPKIDKAKLKKNTLFYDPRQHLAEVTCSSTTPFKVLTDGVLHGPYRSVRICVALTKSDGRVAQFPIQTFFPIQSSP